MDRPSGSSLRNTFSLNSYAPVWRFRTTNLKLGDREVIGGVMNKVTGPIHPLGGDGLTWLR